MATSKTTLIWITYFLVLAFVWKSTLKLFMINSYLAKVLGDLQEIRKWLCCLCLSFQIWTIEKHEKCLVVRVSFLLLKMLQLFDEAVRFLVKSSIVTSWLWAAIISSIHVSFHYFSAFFFGYVLRCVCVQYIICVEWFDFWSQRFSVEFAYIHWCNGDSSRFAQYWGKHVRPPISAWAKLVFWWCLEKWLEIEWSH